MKLLELTADDRRKPHPIIVNLDLVTDLRPLGDSLTQIVLAVHDPQQPEQARLLVVRESYADIVRCIRETLANVANVAAWTALRERGDHLPAEWEPWTVNPEQAAEMEAELAADAAYQDDAALRQFARAVWARGFRAGHAAGRDEVR